MADGVTYAGALAACVGLAAIVRAVVRRPLSRSELEYAAAFWRRAALRAVWRGDERTEAFAEQQYRACEERLRATETTATKGP